jgi:nucleoside-diphosphate-sugar epimerase
MPLAYVTGGSGFLGRHAVEHLRSAGWRVVALHRQTSDISALIAAGAETVIGDVTDADAVLRSMPEEADLVIHAAADTSPWKGNAARLLATNIEGTRAVAAASLAKRASRFVFVSSVSAWGDPPPRSEADPQQGKRSWVAYQRSKHLAEEVLASYIERGLHAVIVNPTHILGAYDTANWGRMIGMVDKGALPGIPPGTGVFADARQIARVLPVVAERGRVGANYLLGGPRASFTEFVALIGETLSIRVPRRPTPGGLLYALAYWNEFAARFTGVEPELVPETVNFVTQHLNVDDTKARTELGYQHSPLPDMVFDAARWMYETGRIRHEPRRTATVSPPTP